MNNSTSSKDADRHFPFTGSAEAIVFLFGPWENIGKFNLETISKWWILQSGSGGKNLDDESLISYEKKKIE